jgi:hypothetical protein
VSLLLLLEVAVAALSAALLAGEPFGVREAAGCILILAAGALEGGAELRPALRRRSALPLAVPRSARARRPPAAEEQAVRADDAAESREPMCGGRSGDGA